MAVYKDEEDGVEATCALGCSCLLSCFFMFGIFFTVSGAVLYILSNQYGGDGLYFLYDAIDLQTFALVVLCVGAALTALTLCCVIFIKCSQYYIKKSIQQQIDKNTPLVSRSVNYHYNTYDQPFHTHPPPAYSETHHLP